MMTNSLQESPSSVSTVTSTIWVLFASYEAFKLSNTSVWINEILRVFSSSLISICLPSPFFVGVSSQPARSCISPSTDEASFC